ncbi:CDP-diacylglycerol--glycerol-3-phosphate 3-phosphatidyltransferase 2-like [Syzygium oleosum]|uniref:CDP-diacylglycerol--glycerol-3-phosphate 3-phosphatidyltransferase 2-like n=1 Tax=Syzygium oleosum TaxID=219896 RepID=UPI0011D27594|nr:CDP-diacylglycerol--glycerol-3-phosphate 3-phosphatidyltransferase 2-like [Syzygium oleosum]
MPSVNLKFSASLRGSHPHKLIRFLASSATTAAIPSPRTNLWLLARASSSARRSPAAALSRAWVAAPLDGRYGILRGRTSSGAGSYFVRRASRGCKCDSSSSSSGIEGGKNEGLLRDDGGKSSSQLESGNQRPPPPSVQNQEEKTDQLLTLPTILTLGRVAAVPLLVSTFYLDTQWGTTATTGIFIAAAITDWLDGYLARKMGSGSAFGAFLDPVADKLMVAAILVLLCSRPLEISMFGQVPWLITAPAIAIIGREITMSAVREWAVSQDSKLLEAVAVNKLGKWKTATQMTALTILLATRDSSLRGAESLVASGVVLLYTSAGLALWSLIVYMKKIWKVLLKQHS